MPRFTQDLDAEGTHEELKRQIEQCFALRIYGFPSLVLLADKFARRLPVEFNDPGLQLEIIADAAGLTA